MNALPRHALRPNVVVTTFALAVVAVLLGSPFVALVAGAIHVGPTHVVAAVADAAVLGALLRSVVVAAVCVVVNGAFGVACAIVLVRHREFPGRRFIDVVLDLPFGVSPVMTGLAFLLLFGRGGWFPEAHVAFAFPALVVATLFVTMPFVAREVAHVLEHVGDAEEEAASTLGASATTTFLRVTLPNIAPALASGVTLTAARALGEFGAVLVVGGSIAGRTDTATTLLYAALEERREPVVIGVALLLSAASMALLALLTKVKRT